MLNSANPNDITLASYDAEVNGYIAHTPAAYQHHHAPLLRWLNSSLEMISKNDKILEVGSGFGRDANYIHSKGYDITCSDGSKAFVNFLNKNGWDAKQLNILKNNIPNGYKMILANAVIPHFTQKQFELILTKILAALPEGGLFAFSVKQGQGEDWITEKFSAKRFIHYWDLQSLKEYIERANCKIVFWEEGIPGDLPSHTWTNLTLMKQ